MFNDLDIAILTIRPDEFDAVREALKLSEFRISGEGLSYVFGKVEGAIGRPYNVGLFRTIDPGNDISYQLCAGVNAEFRPRLFVVCGVAGAPAWSDARLGDVVFSNYIHDFRIEERRPEGSRFQLRGGDVHKELRGLLGTLHARIGFTTWNTSRPNLDVLGLEAQIDNASPEIQKSLIAYRAQSTPTVHVGTIASSDNLAKDEKQLETLRTGSRKYLVVEMESSGAYGACENAAPPVLMIAIRAVSDICGGPRHDALTTYACKVAAEALRQYLLLEPIPVMQVDALISSLGRIPDEIPKTLFDDACRRLALNPIRQLEQYIERGLTRPNQNGTLSITLPKNDPGKDDKSILALLLELLCGQIRDQQNEFVRATQIPNAVALAVAYATPQASLALIETVFDALDKPIKAAGRFDLLLQLAAACKTACNVPNRGREHGNVLARVLICASSWVYQRQGEFRKAETEISEALRICKAYQLFENLAFSKKCLGRVKRLLAAETKTPSESKALLADSKMLLEDAAADFEKMAEKYGPEDDEVADCFTLLGETQLHMGDLTGANKSLARAKKILGGKRNKEYFELKVLEANLALARQSASDAERALSEVLALNDEEGSATLKELVVRALIVRGRVKEYSSDRSGARLDYKQASEIAARYSFNFLSDVATINGARLEPYFTRDVKELLAEEPRDVRASVIRLFEKRIASSKSGLVAQRLKIDITTWKDLLQEARLLGAYPVNVYGEDNLDSNSE